MKRLFAVLGLLFLSALPLRAQSQPTTQAPIFNANAAYVNGVAPGYWPTAGGGLTLAISLGQAFCPTTNTVVQYAGGTLTMTNNTTNYVYLDAAVACAPAKNTTGFTATTIPVATVVTSGGSITSIADDRVLGFSAPTASGASNPNVAPVFNITNPTYSGGASGLAEKANDCSTVNGSHTITCSPSAPFTSGMAGWIIWCQASSDDTVKTLAQTTIATFTSSTVIQATGTAQDTVTGSCVFGPQDDSNAIIAAYAAAKTPAGSKAPNGFTGATTGYAGTVYCPPGGYIATKTIVNFTNVGGTAPSIRGGDDFGGKCVIYMSNTFTDSTGGAGALMLVNGPCCFSIKGISVEGMGFTYAFAGGDFIRLINTAGVDLESLFLGDMGTSGGGAVLDCNGCSDLHTGSLFIQAGGGGSDSSTALLLQSTNNATLVQSFLSNHPTNLTVNGNAPCRTPTASSVSFIGGFIDEGGVSVGLANGCANFDGLSIFGIVNIDATSTFYGSQLSVGHFNSASNFNAFSIAAGGSVSLTQSTVWGNGSNGAGLSAAFSGPAGATYNDVGGNILENCQSTVCTLVTPANFATFGFTGGINPKSSLTHTPNTCYDVPGGVTADVLCAFKADQNYQIVNIKASSNVTVTCATPIVITVSDGTRSATLTLTSGKSVWDSSVDASTGIFNVMASNATVTTTKAAGVCSVPPVNLEVSPMFQSVLNQ